MFPVKYIFFKKMFPVKYIFFQKMFPGMMWHRCHSHLKTSPQLPVLLLAATIHTTIQTGLWGKGTLARLLYRVSHKSANWCTFSKL